MKKIKLLCFSLMVIMFFGLYNVSAITEITCRYNRGPDSYTDASNDGFFDLTFRVSGDDIEMIDCTRRNGSEIVSNDCAKYIFDSKTYALANEDSCPSSINLDILAKKFIWVTDKKGVFKLESKLKDSIKNVGQTSCINYNKEKSCKNSLSNGKVACVWVENEDAPNGGFCNVDNLLYVGCGGASDIPVQAPAIISLAVNLLKIATPIILIFVSIVTLLKAMSAQKEDEIKKATSSLVRKIIASALVFFVVSIVQFIISVVASDDADYNNFSNCLDCFLNNNCKISTYYKTVVGGEDYCTSLSTGKTETCLYTGRINNGYYQGTKSESCSGEYFSNGYQPDSIKINGKCHKLEDSGSKILIGLVNLNSELKFTNQTLLTANGKYYYWNTKENKYVEVSKDIEVVTPYYRGTRIKDCGNGYFDNGYQPRDISIDGTCYKLEKSGKTVLVSHVRLDMLSEQTLWKANGSCYYWNSGYNRYDEVACDTELINRYYIGKMAEAGSKGYFDNGYQPREIKLNGTWYKLEDSGSDYTFSVEMRNGEIKKRTQTKWKANGKYYYWSPKENKYLEI